jgi:hypothetical protein
MKNIIEINGRKYDAISGRLLEPNSPTIKIAPQKQPLPNNLGPGMDIDGVRRHKPQNSQATKTAQPLKSRLSGSLHQAPFKAEKSQTLIRRIVKKPNATARSLTQPARPIVPHSTARQLFGKIPAERLNRAGQITHNNSASRFGAADFSQPKLSSNLKVTPAPKSTGAPAAAPFLSKTLRNRDGRSAFRHPLNNILPSHQPTKSATARLKAITKHLNFNLKVIGMVLLGLVILAALAFVIYKKVPTADMWLADVKAGFSGHVPAIVPVGYTFTEPIISHKGVIAVQFKSAVNHDQFAITQRPSGWSSVSLASNFLANSKLPYQTYAAPDGLTIYVYAVGNATWVDSGIWYTITGTDALSTNQILAIADSM